MRVDEPILTMYTYARDGQGYESALVAYVSSILCLLCRYPKNLKTKAFLCPKQPSRSSHTDLCVDIVARHPMVLLLPIMPKLLLNTLVSQSK